jgi:hypothetical protein
MSILAAHLRLLATLPVRTHRQPEPVPRQQKSARLPRWKVERMRELDGRMPRRRIAELLGVSHAAVQQHLGRAPRRPRTRGWR